MREKRDIYQEVTDKIVASLEAGTVPWHKPWTNVNHGPARSLRSNKPYRGVNVFLLALASLEGGYTDPRWGTYKAIAEAGGQVRKGEKSTGIVFWKRIDPRDGEIDPATGKPKRPFFMLRGFNVFNVEQADGIESLPTVALTEHERNEQAEALVASFVNYTGEFTDNPGPSAGFGGNSAHYAPARDHVQIPVLGQFDSADAHYSTLYHELVHSTGHESRLNRPDHQTFGDDPYAKEELVAELGAAMLAALVGVETTRDNSAAYIAHWAERFKGDKKLIVQAAAQAQKAADLVVGTTFEEGAGDNAALAAAA